jgi:uncharacterized membrane protein YjjP (DUF1212 family)
LVHDVYRKVVHDEISVSQGSRALRRITKEVGINQESIQALDLTVILQFKPYPRYVLLIASAMIAATGSAVAFSGSVVDMLMSAVLGSFLGFVMLYVVGRGRTATNIFEIGTAGLIAFLAVSTIATLNGNIMVDTCFFSLLRGVLEPQVFSATHLSSR